MCQHPENTAITGSILAVRKAASRLKADLAEMMMTIMVAIRLLIPLLLLDGAAKRHVNA